MKLNLPILLTLLLTSFLLNAQECHFVGIYKTGKGLCDNDEIIQEKILLSGSLKHYSDFKAKHQGLNPHGTTIKPSESAIIYSFEKRIGGYDDCHPVKYVVITAPMIEDCKKELEKRIENQNKKGKASEYHTQPKIIAEFEGKPAAKNTKGTVDLNKKGEALTNEIEGVKSTFKMVSNGSKKKIFTQFKNTNAKYSVVILKLADGTVEKILLEPNGSINKDFQTDKLDVQVELLDKQKGKPDLNLINFVKEKVKETIIEENGKLKVNDKKPMVTGVRG